MISTVILLAALFFNGYAQIERLRHSRSKRWEWLWTVLSILTVIFLFATAASIHWSIQDEAQLLIGRRIFFCVSLLANAWLLGAKIKAKTGARAKTKASALPAVSFLIVSLLLISTFR